MPTITTGPGASQSYMQTMPRAIAPPFTGSSKVVSGNEQTAEPGQSKVENSRQTRSLNQEYASKKNQIEQNHEIRKQRIESEYNQKRQSLEQEYKQKQRTVGVNLYV